MTGRRARGIAIAIIMLDTIRRFLFEGAKPIDRTMLCIELAVLLVIIYVGNPVEGERDSGLKPNTIPL